MESQNTNLKISLNPSQLEATRTFEGPLLILAGAGSGKTGVITHRILRMIQNKIPPSSIVAVTFTNKSAREMKSRLSKMTERKSIKGMVLSTFHSLGNRILSSDIERLGSYRNPFSIFSTDDLNALYANIYREIKLDPSTIKEDAVSFLVSLCKNSGLDPMTFAEANIAPAKFSPPLFADIYERYHNYLRSLNGVDFDDLILLPTKLLKEHSDLLAKYHHRWRYFLVDEFQDTNPAQYDLLNLLVGDRLNICVVGDDDQSIYGWRGADVNIMLGFKKRYPHAKVIRLEENYRSTKNILDAANAVIANNSIRTDKKLRATGAVGKKITGFLAEDEEHEATLVVEEIHHAIIHKGKRAGEFAILFRTNFQSRAFEQELRRRSIPLHVVGGYRFFDRSEVKDMIAYLRVIANHRDELSLKRIINRPRRGIGDAVIRKINQYIMTLEEKEQVDFGTVLYRMMETPHLIAGVKPDAVASIREFLLLIEEYRKAFTSASKLTPVFAQLVHDLKWEHEFFREGLKENAVRAKLMNISELVNMMSYMEENHDENAPPTLFDFLSRLSLQQNDDDDEESDSHKGKVQLLTFHLSKGLEFLTVFLTGLEEETLPAGRSLRESPDENQALSEERRLFYVGITRAREELFFTLCASRKKFGESVMVHPSRFLDEVPVDLIEWKYRADAKENTESDKERSKSNFLQMLDSV